MDSESCHDDNSDIRPQRELFNALKAMLFATSPTFWRSAERDLIYEPLSGEARKKKADAMEKELIENFTAELHLRPTLNDLTYFDSYLYDTQKEVVEAIGVELIRKMVGFFREPPTAAQIERQRKDRNSPGILHTTSADVESFLNFNPSLTLDKDAKRQQKDALKWLNTTTHNEFVKAMFDLGGVRVPSYSTK